MSDLEKRLKAEGWTILPLVTFETTTSPGMGGLEGLEGFKIFKSIGRAFKKVGKKIKKLTIKKALKIIVPITAGLVIGPALLKPSILLKLGKKARGLISGGARYVQKVATPRGIRAALLKAHEIAKLKQQGIDAARPVAVEALGRILGINPETVIDDSLPVVGDTVQFPAPDAPAEITETTIPAEGGAGFPILPLVAVAALVMAGRR